MYLQQRVRPSGAAPMGGGSMISAQNQNVSGGIQTGFQLGGQATGPAILLIGIVALLVLDYVWTRGQQGGR
jgi:hypothetical protein